MILPNQAHPLLFALSAAFTQATFHRFTTLMAAAILTTGRRLYHALPQEHRVGTVRWPGKGGVTFSDALSAVRRWLWSAAVFPQAGSIAGIEKLSEPLREIIFLALAPAA